MKHSTILSTRLLIASVVMILMTAMATTAWGQISLTEDFNYSGALTSNGWTAHSALGTNAISTTTGLSYAGYTGSGIGNAALVQNLGGEDDNLGFSTINGNGTTVYYSALINVTDPASSQDRRLFYAYWLPFRPDVIHIVRCQGFAGE